MRRLHLILKGESTFDDLLRRQRLESTLQERIHRVLPPALAKHVAVIDATSAELELIAASGAAAALLRQRAPELLAALAHEGFEFTGIRVRVQARPAFEPPPKPIKKQLDKESAATISSLAETLGDSPLAASLRRLAGKERGPAPARDTMSAPETNALSPTSAGRDQPLEGVEDKDSEQ